MNPTSPKHEDHGFNPLPSKTHNLVEVKHSTESQESYPNSDQEGKFALDLNFPNVDPKTGYRIVDGAIYIDSDDDGDTDVDTATREQYKPAVSNDSKASKSKGIVVEGEEEEEEEAESCDNSLTLELGLPSKQHFCGQVLGSPSSSKNNELMPNFVCHD